MKAEKKWIDLGWRHPLWNIIRMIPPENKTNIKKAFEHNLKSSGKIEFEGHEPLIINNDIIELYSEYQRTQSELFQIAFEKLRDEDEAVDYCEKNCFPVKKTETRNKTHHQSSAAMVSAVTSIAEKVCSTIGLPINSNPQGRCAWHHKNEILVSGRNLDGAIPSLINPELIWEIKEYWGKTKGGSKMSDALYECHLIGLELRDYEERVNQKINHIVFLDGKSQWSSRRSDLRRFIDIMNQGLIDYLIIGKEVENDWEEILEQILTNNVSGSYPKISDNDCIEPENVLSKGMFHCLFPQNVVLTPQLNEVYELALAYYESRILSEEELVQNGAYFARIGDQFTNHYLMCTGESVRLPHYSSSRLKSFFQKNQFRTGYATHGLFPYRGKFHPQMIKALINVMGLKPGDTVLDPMMGSGTVPIEASLMKIRSIGIDASPFCRFMTQVKYNSLTLPTTSLDHALKKTEKLFEIFSDIANESDPTSNTEREEKSNSVLPARQFLMAKQRNALNQIANLIGDDLPEIYDFLFLAYLDGAGYAERSKKKSPLTLFQAILERYVFVVKKIQDVMHNFNLTPSSALILEGDSRHMSIEDCSVDGIVFSPPYSFAINYLENDAFHLNCIGTDIAQLKEQMIGLRGKNVKEKYESYIADMDKVLSECARVLKPSCFCTMVIGTNDNQLSKALGIPKEEVKGLHKIIVEMAANHGFKIIRRLARQISGISNTMRNEYILFLKLKDYDLKRMKKSP